MSEPVVLIAIAVLAAAFILWPLVRGRMARPAVRSRSSAAPAAGAGGEGGPAQEQLSELELDRAMGRVSEENYARFRNELESGATEPGLPPAPANVARAEALVRRWSTAPRPTCPSCGERPEPEARYCSSCGTRLAS